jgi:hypothetical protein
MSRFETEIFPTNENLINQIYLIGEGIDPVVNCNQIMKLIFDINIF